MGTRLELQSKFEELLGSRHVYYQPPEGTKIEYPAIKYSINNIESNYANNAKYSNHTRYDVIVISRTPNDEIIQKILAMPYSSFDRHYVSNNLNHDSLTLYF